MGDGTMRTVLLVLVDEREWRAYPAFAAAYRRAATALAREENDPDVSRNIPAQSTYEAWLYGTRQPTRAFRRVLKAMFETSVEELMAPAGTRQAVSLDGTSHTATHDTARLDIGRSVSMAARRAMEFALGAEQQEIGEETIGFLQDEVRRLAEVYPRVPLPDILDDIAQAQDQAFLLIEGGRGRPSQDRDLHVMAALLSGLMAKASHDLGDHRSALMQARTASVCTTRAEHPGIGAWVAGLKSLISYWAGKPDAALVYARQGAQEHPQLHGSVSAWLPSLEARAAAMLGDEATAASANRRASAARGRLAADDLDDLGGLLVFPEQKQLYYTVECGVLLGVTGPLVVEQAEAAVNGFSDRTLPHWAFGDEAGAHTNLALARLHNGDLDGAADAVRPVLDLGPSQRNRGWLWIWVGESFRCERGSRVPTEFAVTVCFDVTHGLAVGL